MLVTPVTWSYAGALRAPGTDSVAARTGEWMRDHHLGSVVNSVEHWWYSHHPPPVGGRPAGGIPTITTHPGPAASMPTNATSSGAPTPRSVVGLRVPPPVAPPVHPALRGEGSWQDVGLLVRATPAVRFAYVRADAVHTSRLAAVAWFDTTLLRADIVPGLQEPPGFGDARGARVPQAARPGLVAAFNSAFRVKDARGGVYLGGKGAATLRRGAASLVVRSDGTLTVGEWGRDFVSVDGVVAVRQNLDLIVDGGAPVAGLNNNMNGRWGWTLGNNVFVWRSAVGVTASGAIIYVAGDSLSVTSLADLLVRAGAVRAMELDINPDWVSCFVFNHPDPARPATVEGVKLIDAMHRPGNRYLVAGSRDFVMLSSR